jgi:hypothetical protein
MSEYATGVSQGHGLGDSVIYYRRPFLTRDGDAAENAGWITWADSLSGTKLRDYEYRGFTPLRKYGAMNNEDRLNVILARGKREGWTKRQFDNEWLWGGILRHPDGPAEFPLDQIMAFRWYDPQHCPLRDVNPVELFPQLRGHKVKIHRCPQCPRTFAAVDGYGAAEPFANHLRIMHEYDMVNILNFGQRIGIDFTGVHYGPTGEAKELTFGEAEDVEDALTCGECGAEFKGKMAAARLAKHAKEHPVFEMETA